MGTERPPGVIRMNGYIQKESSAQHGSPDDAGGKRSTWVVIGLALAVLVGVGVYYRIIWGSVAGFVQAMDFCDKLFCDFVIYYYQMGRKILATNEPAIGFYYSPLFAIGMAPFAALELQTSLVLWGIVMIVSTAGLGVLSYRTAPPASRLTMAGFLLLFLTSFPILHNFKWGQVSVLLVLLVVASLVLYEKGWVIVPAILLALSVSLKYYPFIFLVYFIVHRDWKFVVIFLISIVVFLFLIPAVVLGVRDTLDFLQQLATESGAVQRAAGGPNSQSLKNVLARLIPVGRESVEFSRILFAALGYFLLQANLVVIVLMRKFARHEALTMSFMLLFLSIPLFVGTSWPHYLAYLPLCQVLAFEMLRQNRTASPLRRRSLGGLLALSVALASVMMFDLVGSWERYNGAGLLFWSNMSLLAFLYLHVGPRILSLLARRAQQPKP